MTQNDLYTVTACSGCRGDDDAAEYTLAINWACDILRAHFPGSPVVPGACLVQMALDMTRRACRGPVRLQGLSRVKFIRPVTPAECPSITLRLAVTPGGGGILNVSATISGGGVIYAKMTLICNKTQHSNSEN